MMIPFRNALKFLVALWRDERGGSPATLLFQVEEQQKMARRRGQRSGWLREKNGTWLLTYRDYKIEGDNRVTKTIGPAEGPEKLTKKQAERLAWDLHLSPLDNATRLGVTKIRVVDFWMKEYFPHLERNRKYATQSQYRTLWINWLEPAFGHVRLFQLGVQDIEKAIKAALAKKKSTATAKHIRKVAASMIKHAKSKGMYMGENPGHLVDVPAHIAVRAPRALTIEQARLWLSSVKDIQPDPEDKRSDLRPLRTMSLLGICCSLGVSEQLGLTWQYVNLADEPVLVGIDRIEPRSVAVVDHCYHGRKGTLKTGSRRRIVPLPKVLVEALTELREASKWKEPEHAVLAGVTGKPIWGDNLQARTLKPLARTLEMPWLSYLVFRHTCATLTKTFEMLEPDRQMLMGHAPRTMTDRYTHEDYERVRAGVEKIAAEITQPPKKTVQRETAVGAEAALEANA